MVDEGLKGCKKVENRENRSTTFENCEKQWQTMNNKGKQWKTVKMLENGEQSVETGEKHLK